MYNSFYFMKAYSQDLRDRAILLFNDGYNRKEISKTLNIHYETIKNWVKRYIKTGDYSSKQHLNKGVERRFTDKEAVIKYLEKHPNAISSEIRDAVAPSLPISTFKDTLSWMGITYKKKETAYIQRDEKKRKIFIDKLSKLDINKLVFIDETGTEDNICSLYGYAEIGKRSYSFKNAFTKKRLSTIAGYRHHNQELLAPFEYAGTANKNLFLGWFEQILIPTLDSGDYIILDNASIHKGCEIYEIYRVPIKMR